MSDYKVVIVDDDSAMRDSLSDYFTLSGFKVMAYESGLEMLKEISNIGPCVIICDLKMPIINGIEVLKKLKSIVNPAPLIMLNNMRFINISCPGITPSNKLAYFSIEGSTKV